MFNIQLAQLIVGVLQLGVVIAVLVLIINNSKEPEMKIVPTSTMSTTGGTTTNKPVIIEQRSDWSKHPAWRPQISRMEHPVKEIFISDTGYRYTHQICDDYNSCLSQVKQIENSFDSVYPANDLPYNFMVPNMEIIFEGRGWTYDGGIENTIGGDRIVFIALIGTYTQMLPTVFQLDMLWSLINEGIKAGYIDPAYKIHTECQMINIYSPGIEFLHEIQKWPQWSNVSDRWSLKECYMDTTTEATTVTTEMTQSTTTLRPLNFVWRSNWSKHPAWRPQIDRMEHPVTEVFLSDTGQRYGHQTCNDYSSCLSQVKQIEDSFRSYPFDDLPYNFMIPNIDVIFEGRGWTYDGAIQKTKGGDRIVFIAVMGTFIEVTPTNLQFDLLWSLINEGIMAGYISPDYKIHMECQIISIHSPGSKLLKEIQSWSQWSDSSTKWDLRECYTPSLTSTVPILTNEYKA